MLSLQYYLKSLLKWFKQISRPEVGKVPNVARPTAISDRVVRRDKSFEWQKNEFSTFSCFFRDFPRFFGFRWKIMGQFVRQFYGCGSNCKSFPIGVYFELAELSNILH